MTPPTYPPRPMFRKLCDVADVMGLKVELHDDGKIYRGLKDNETRMKIVKIVLRRKEQPSRFHLSEWVHHENLEIAATSLLEKLEMPA